MSAPLAYHITWTTYGSRLPGDERGWVMKGFFAIQEADPEREQVARERMIHGAVELNEAQRELVAKTIRQHCEFRKWTLYAVNVRTNHVHVVVTAPIAPEKVMGQFKAWCSRRLSEQFPGFYERWWTKGGSTKWINDEEYLHEAIDYDLNRQ